MNDTATAAPVEARPLPAAAQKLIDDATVAGLIVRVTHDAPMVLVSVRATVEDGTNLITGHWWNTPDINGFEYAATYEVRNGKAIRSRRASSLKAARAHVGLGA